MGSLPQERTIFSGAFTRIRVNVTDLLNIKKLCGPGCRIFKVCVCPFICFYIQRFYFYVIWLAIRRSIPDKINVCPNYSTLWRFSPTLKANLSYYIYCGSRWGVKSSNRTFEFLGISGDPIARIKFENWYM